MVSTAPNSSATPGEVLAIRNAVGTAFVVAGVLFASLASRLPDVRSSLDLDNAALGLLLLAIAVGSLVALPSAGRLIDRWGAGAVVRLGAGLDLVGLVVASLGAAGGSVVATAAGWVLYGVGIGVWDVAMNVEAAEVERRLGRTVMPRFHAGWSLGSIAGAAVGIPMAALHVPMPVHLIGAVVLVAAAGWWAGGRFAPVEQSTPDDAPSTVRGRSAWLEPRTLAIGVMVLAFAMVEGTANDWLSLGLIDGYDVPHWVGVSGFALYVTAMTTGRLLGPPLLDRFGRAPVLWACAAAAAIGSLLTVYGGRVAAIETSWPVVAVGIAIWGLGASLGFPVGMSAAADDPTRAAARVSVVSTIGYGAFLAGPPLLGRLGDAIGTLESVLAVTVLMLPAAISVLAAREPRTASAP